MCVKKYYPQIEYSTIYVAFVKFNQLDEFTLFLKPKKEKYECKLS